MVEYQIDIHGFFEEFLPDKDVSRLFMVMEPAQIKKGELLFDCDQNADGMYFVVSGKVAVQKETGFGTRKQVVALIESGAPIGEAGILEGVKRGASVVAVSDTTLLYLSKSAFEEFCKECSEAGVIFLRWLLGRVCMRLRGSTDRLAHVL